jgi:hypothetical protein
MTFWWVSIVKSSLQISLAQNDYSKGIEIGVPSKVSAKRKISRTKDQAGGISRLRPTINL